MSAFTNPILATSAADIWNPTFYSLTCHQDKGILYGVHSMRNGLGIFEKQGF